MPAVDETVRELTLPGLHNTFRLNAKLYSGSEPEGALGFDSLKSLGIRTVISVDGAEPDIAKAHAAGIRYIHLPVGYDGIPEQRRRELLKAFQSADGPVYVHCHHGKHRGPAACSVLMMGLEDWPADHARGWLRMAGTDERYRGLFRLPESFRKPSDSELAAVPGTFPEVATVADLTKRMVTVDQHWSRIRKAKEANWPNHASTADIVLLLMQEHREAQRLKDTAESMKHAFYEAEGTARELEDAVRKGDIVASERLFNTAAGQCASCHKQERDNRPTDRPR
jgi:Putative phosphatase (DUF442)